jgi:hypothetical protein
MTVHKCPKYNDQGHNFTFPNFSVTGKDEIKGKAIPLQPLTGPEGSRILRLPYFRTIGT